MRWAALCGIVSVAIGATTHAQQQTGELRVLVRDATGSAVRATGTLASDATHVERRFATDDSGSYTAQSLPFGLYRIAIESAGFAPYSAVVDIRSAVPLRYPVTLSVAPLVASVQVAPDAPPLIDPYRSGTASFVGADLLRTRPSAPPGHSIVDLVNTLPGWFETSNGVLHPRGAEYQVQYVVDGVPLRDNRSPAFAQSLGVEEFESLTARTAGYPAEFGGKLGGVIELTTVRDRREGFHGTADGQIGSFATLSGYASGQFVRRRTTIGGSVEAMATDRYLDPPVEENFTNRGSGVGIAARIEQEWSDADRSRAYVHRRSTDFLVPNEQFQQRAGQRQTRTSDETLAQLSHQHIVSARIVGQGAVMTRSTTATLDSNAASTPLQPRQDRGFTDIYASGSVTVHAGAHDVKAGGDLTAGTVREAFAAGAFDFADRRHGREQAAFVQDLIRFGPATVSVGMRYDHYRLVENEHAVSPRLSASYFVEGARLVVHGSYDRAFETPPVENVLLASSGKLPLRSSRGHFFEGGVAKEVFGRARVDVNAYRRAISHFFDDDLLLNTAVSFPFTFAHATVNGVEASLDVPRWGRAAASFRYSYSRGIGSLPLSGGLFLSEEPGDLGATGEFPISEDQRHTIRGRVRVDATPRLSLSAAARFDSGLPIEIEGDVDESVLASQYGSRVLERVNFEEGRVKPAMAVDISGALASALEMRVDAAAGLKPNPGWRPFQRLNRAEYTRAVKDLLDVDVDVSPFLPPDQISSGFDNVADSQAFSPALMEGFLRAASHVTALAVGDLDAATGEAHYRVPKTASQTRRVDGAPFGTRGGVSVVHTFPADGEYAFRVELHGNADGFLYGGPANGEQLELSIDGERKALLDIDPRMAEVTSGLALKTPAIQLTAGAHRVTAAFLQRFEGPVNDLIAPIDHTLADTQIGVAYGVTTLPHVKDLSIVGPLRVTGVSETASRRKIFTCRPSGASDETVCAGKIVRHLGTQAFRRPLTDGDFKGLMRFFDEGRVERNFEYGIASAIEAILASPQFVFRLERGDRRNSAVSAQRVGDLELASRLSFFLWGTAPDDELRTLAAKGGLSLPGALGKQVKRMLAGADAETLSSRFATQWLRLNDVEPMLPDAILYPYYDHTLGESLVKETQLFFDSIVREDRSVLDLLTADYTFVNERVARHYGIANVTGNAFQRVPAPEHRRGLLGQGSVLVLTSVADRTSPVMRGKWVMEVLLGSPPPPPPPNVPALTDTAGTAAGKVLTVRERMEEHRKSPACASCHRVIDPLGLALENFDPTGKWRIKDAGVAVDASGVMYDGTKLDGPEGLRSAILKRQDVFLQTFTENLMTYALGRRIEYYDMPTIRRIVRDAEKQNYRISAFINGVVNSSAFQMRADRVVETTAQDR